MYVCFYLDIKKPSTKVLLDEDVRVKITDCESIVYKQVQLQDSRWPSRCLYFYAWVKWVPFRYVLKRKFQDNASLRRCVPWIMHHLYDVSNHNVMPPNQSGMDSPGTHRPMDALAKGIYRSRTFVRGHIGQIMLTLPAKNTLRSFLLRNIYSVPSIIVFCAVHCY